MPFAYHLLRAIVGLILGLIARFEVIGQDNLPPAGPLILATNHIHILDPPALMLASPWPVTAFAARKWSRHFWGLFLRATGAIFVNRGTVDRQALRDALAVLRRGGVLGLAPEGTRSKTSRLQPARPGVAFLAHLAGVPILPVAVTGTEQVFPALLRLSRARVQVAFGQPFMLPAIEGKPTAEVLRQHADLVMHRIAELLPPEYRGAYAAADVVVRGAPAPQG